MPVAVYPHLLAKWLRFLNSTNSPEAAKAAIGGWDAQDLEDLAAKKKLTGTICRSYEEWLEHPQGAALAASPLITIEKIGESPKEPLGEAGRPLQGVRALGFVHAIAGPVVLRTLAEHGADCLCATFPNDFEHDLIYDDANVGTRSCYLDLNKAEARERCVELIRGADIVVDSHRGQAMWKYGLSPPEVAKIRPGIIYVAVRAYGLEGPWADRGGFDQTASAVSGLMVTEGGGNAPRLPVTVMINDYVTGYMGALGALAAMIRRAKEGGSYQVTVSLTRNAMWCRSLGLVDPSEAATTPVNTPLQPETVTGETPLGTLNRLAPPVRFSRTPPHWESPMLVVRGSGKPEWTTLIRR